MSGCYNLLPFHDISRNCVHCGRSLISEHPCPLSLQLLVLKYVQNKDVFMRYHKAHLTRRLILDISADSEIEENMVEWLRVRPPWMCVCVCVFTALY